MRRLLILLKSIYIYAKHTPYIKIIINILQKL